MLKEVRRDCTLLGFLLVALRIVKIHIKVGALLLRERHSLVVDQRCMFDRSHSRTDCILNALCTVCVCRHAQAEGVRFLHRSLQLLRCEFRRVRVAPVGQHRTAGENLDVIYAVMRQQANLLPHFPRAIGFAVMQIPWQLNVWRLPSQRPCATCDRDVRPSYVHARPDDVATRNCISESDVVECAVSAYVSYSSDSRKQSPSRIGHGLEHVSDAVFFTASNVSPFSTTFPSARCVWQSISPGNTVLSERSIHFASFGTRNCLHTAATLFPTIRIS